MKIISWAGDKKTGITAYESICVLVLFVIAFSIIISISPSYFQDGLFSGGLIKGAISESGDSVRIYGTPIGYSSVSREIEGIHASASREDPNALGFFLISVTPIVGDLSIDINRMKITIVSAGNEIPVTLSRTASLGPGNWTIVSKYHMIPMHSADEDDILEGGEIFALLISLPESFTPYQKCTIVLSPEHGIPWKQELTVPPVIKPVTQF